MRTKGLSIVEALVYIAIFTVAMGAVCGLLIYFYKSNAYLIQQSYAVEHARKGIETMVKEIREATYSDAGSYPVVDAAPQIFTFYSDVDRDSKVEKVRYFLDGTNFKRGETESTGSPPVYDPANEEITILSESVRNGTSTVFNYYNASSTEITDLSNITDIRLVRVNLVVNIVPNRPPGEFTLISNAQLRNLYAY